MYEIRLEPDRQLIAIRLWGYWDADTARAFAQAHLATVATLGLLDGGHRVLAHFEGFAVQSQETVAVMQRLIAANRAHRIALVARSALSRVQAQQAMVTPNIRLFERSADAQAWLFERSLDQPAHRPDEPPPGAQGLRLSE